MVRVCSLAVALQLVASLAASAADFSVAVTDQNGDPVENAVIGLMPDDKSRLPAADAQTHTIDQTDEAFVPFVTAMRRGDALRFTNSDRTRHHVYSFSTIKQFELLLNPGQKSNLVKFDEDGVAAIGCNIHDQMLAYAFVSESPWFAVTDAKGAATIRNVPQGKLSAHAWHPRLDPDRLPADQDVKSPTVAFKLQLVPGPSQRQQHKRHY